MPIKRNDEEQAAFEALTEVLEIPRDIWLNGSFLAEFIDHELLVRGYQLIKIDEITSLREVADEAAAESRKSASLGFFD